MGKILGCSFGWSLTKIRASLCYTFESSSGTHFDQEAAAMQLVILFSSLVLALGDILAYNDFDFDELTRNGKHLIQFFHESCHSSISMIDHLLDIDTAVGGGSEDIWIARVSKYANSDLIRRFDVQTTPTFVYVVGSKYYKVNHYENFHADNVASYLRSGFLSDPSYDIPPPSVDILNAQINPDGQVSLFPNVLEKVFAEVDLTFLLLSMIAIVISFVAGKFLIARSKTTEQKTKAE